jgi:hypothetical protein
MLGTPITETRGRDKEKGNIFMAVSVGNIGKGLGGEGGWVYIENVNNSHYRDKRYG